MAPAPIRLSDWSNRSSIYVLDHEGSVIVGPERGTATGHGYAGKVDGDVYALYRADSRLWLRANNLEWDTQEITFRYHRVLMLESVSVRRGRKREFSRSYLGFSRWKEALRDPTFDVIDADDIYFLSWCSRMLASASSRESIFSRLSDSVQ